MRGSVWERESVGECVCERESVPLCVVTHSVSHTHSPTLSLSHTHSLAYTLPRSLPVSLSRCLHHPLSPVMKLGIRHPRKGEKAKVQWKESNLDRYPPPEKEKKKESSYWRYLVLLAREYMTAHHHCDLLLPTSGSSMNDIRQRPGIGSWVLRG